MKIENKRGNYWFLKGISPYSAGVAAAEGYQIEHVRLHPWLPLRAGFDVIDRRLKALKRSRQALCAIELRSPRPFTFQGFGDFNSSYVDILKDWNILQDGLNPIARTNVAPEQDPPAEPVLYGFSYTIPAPKTPLTFVVAGAGELPEGTLDPHDVVRRGETTTSALAEKARFVMGLMEARLRGLDADWSQVTTTDIYTVHDICTFLKSEILGRIGLARTGGVTWHYARPPIVSIEFEMDLRGCRREIHGAETL